MVVHAHLQRSKNYLFIGCESDERVSEWRNV